MRRIWLIFSQAVTVSVAILFVVATLKPEWLARPPGLIMPEVVPILTAPAEVAAAAGRGYAEAARRASPAVVSIVASKAPPRNPHAGDPWFRFFFGDSEEDPQRQRGLGSGVIVSPAGYLLTNNHVIDGADEIEVQLSDGRSAQATVVGTDPDTDLALLKINLDRLPAITLAPAASLQVGDAVLAIGNPFGVGQTVTSGIVSALGRSQLGLSTFENFIQTDAAINPGNSGGALVDANGLLVGINTAIFSRSGGSLGIGFAIPVEVARQVMEGLIQNGQVTRGWIGVEPRDLNPEIAEMLRLPVRNGVLITGVLRGGPAAKAGVQPGDVVLKVGSQAVANTAELLTAVSALAPESKVSLTLQRGQQAIERTLVVAQRPAARREPAD
ncbi:MAG: trypsin-like peptidase domain-containing protein [Burkholderiales bacterium]|nr:trypsin-like peptidase domain-containing protein [Burkholderiales bacterium]NBO75776.1 PDZ domain-containing protein [Betaproteobacteria bacterium]